LGPLGRQQLAHGLLTLLEQKGIVKMMPAAPPPGQQQH
jgi:hypothetical protein